MAYSEAAERQREIWSAGDFPAIASRIEPVSLALLETLDPGPGARVLDVACGTGNLALPAARGGALVTGLDITPKLLEVARERARDAGLEIDFVEGDATQLPFADDSFDFVTSVFGTMFAPDHRRTANEMARVCRPGGRIGFCAWTPQGMIGQMFSTVASHLPPPEPGFEPPILWGEENHVRDLLSPLGAEPRLERRSVTFEEASVEEGMARDERDLGPIVLAKAALEPAGEWEVLRGELVSLYESANESRDSFRAQAEYLMTTVDVPGPGAAGHPR